MTVHGSVCLGAGRVCSETLRFLGLFFLLRRPWFSRPRELVCPVAISSVSARDFLLRAARTIPSVLVPPQLEQSTVGYKMGTGGADAIIQTILPPVGVAFFARERLCVRIAHQHSNICGCACYGESWSPPMPEGCVSNSTFGRPRADCNQIVPLLAVRFYVQRYNYLLTAQPLLLPPST